MKRIAVVGAGAMGSVYGACLSQVAEVNLIDVWEEHVKRINEEGLKVEWLDGTERIFKVRAFTNPQNVGEVDLVIIFVKSYVTEEAVKFSLPLVGMDTLFLTLQNGLGNAEKIASIVGKDRVLCGTTTAGATLLGPGKVRYAGRGETTFGPFGQVNEEKVIEIRDLFEKAGLAPILVDDPLRNVWRKLIINVGINPITAIAKVLNGRIPEDPNLKALSELLVEEACLVAKAEGYSFDTEEMKNVVLEVARRTARNRSSMLQDILNKRRTEIDAINGEVVSRGKKYGISVGANEAITLLIKFMESGISGEL
ncbi:MAG: 2-dehydropantoate 2-reductase [Synergistetes bacterium]|nr:2-dehydropantoate 2-reductase [Synergistota bacterium]MCX8128182.1 2-dehydropantoate 2-reductase [Synergistota bacterium]MDW8192558.1 2-dehydropantoate 2-reductase [Synergistota bacterium]